MNHRVVSGFSVTVVLLVLIGWYSHRSILDFRQTAERVSRSRQFMFALESILTDVVSAESEVRGFYISGNPNHLKLYEETRAELSEELNRIRTLEAQAASREDLDQLISLIEMRLERLRVIVERRQKEGVMTASDGVSGENIVGVGKKIMDQVREVADRMETSETQELEIQAGRLRRVAERTTWVIGIGSVLAVLFHLLSTVALSRSIANRERLERSLLEVSEREQRRIGQDLHDGLCQQLTGISLMLKSLQGAGNSEQNAGLGHIISLINSSIEETRLVTRGLHPVPDEPGGLIVGLKELADSIDAKGSVRCELAIQGDVQIFAPEVSSNVYRIAQEAVRNALKHSEATLIRVVLSVGGGRLVLRVEDNGKGWPIRQSRSGLGLEIMRYRAASIGGQLQLQPSHSTGVAVCFEMEWKTPGAPVASLV